MDSAFKGLENRGVSLALYKFIYLVAAGTQLAVVLYKLYHIGLLPLNSADWIDLVPYHHVIIPP